MSVCCECCVLSDRSLCVGLITRPEESYRVRASECDRGTSWRDSVQFITLTLHALYTIDTSLT